MNLLLVAVLLGVAVYLLWQWDRDARRRRRLLLTLFRSAT
jgi:hypothetical protein